MYASSVRLSLTSRDTRNIPRPVPATRALSCSERLADRARVAVRRNLERVAVLALAPGGPAREPRREPGVAAERGGVLRVCAAELPRSGLEREEVPDLDDVAVGSDRRCLRLRRRARLSESTLALYRRDASCARPGLRARGA